MMLRDAMRPGAENELLDFQLSELFGLDWQKYDYKRMSYIIAFVNYRNERQNRDIKKSNRTKHGR